MTFVSQVWDKHYGERCIGVSWDMFASIDEILVSNSDVCMKIHISTFIGANGILTQFCIL